MSTIRTATCLRTEDGRFHAFEGCADGAGAALMNCTHVWNYAQALAYLFPQLERSARRTDFASNTRPTATWPSARSSPSRRAVGPARRRRPDGHHPQALQRVADLRRRGFLRKLWPAAKRALDSPGSLGPRRRWRHGGEQHNTYDIEFYGPNPLTSILYLGALRAGGDGARPRRRGGGAGVSPDV